MANSPAKSFYSKYVCCWHRRNKTIESTYDPRFGAAEITAPNHGSYSNPQYNAPSTVVVPRTTKTPEHLKRSDIFDRRDSAQRVSPTFSQGTTATRSSRTQSQLGSPYTPTSVSSTMSVPVHEAFIPGDRHAVKTVSIASPSSSPPASPPLPTPTSTGGHRSLMPLPPGQSPTFQDTMSRHQQVEAPPALVVPPLSAVNEKPSPADSIEQWPGSM